MDRKQKSALFLAVAIIGGIGIALPTILVIGPVHGTAPAIVRIIAGTLIVTLAMAWACFFAARAHFVQDEFRRQREILASYWGCLLGIAVSAPVFFFMAVGSLGHLAIMNAPPLCIFTVGYLLPTIFAAIGAIGARFWLLYRDR